MVVVVVAVAVAVAVAMAVVVAVAVAAAAVSIGAIDPVCPQTTLFVKATLFLSVMCYSSEIFHKATENTRISVVQI